MPDLLKQILICLGLFLLVPNLAFATQSSLPESVRADLLRKEIVASVNAGEAANVLTLLDEYKTLKTIKFPMELYYLEGLAAHQVGDHRRALRSLEKYLSEGGSGSRNYQKALDLYSSILKATKKSASELDLSDRTNQALAEIVFEVPGIRTKMRETSTGTPELFWAIADGCLVRVFREAGEGGMKIQLDFEFDNPATKIKFSNDPTKQEYRDTVFSVNPIRQTITTGYGNWRETNTRNEDENAGIFYIRPRAGPASLKDGPPAGNDEGPFDLQDQRRAAAQELLSRCQ